MRGKVWRVTASVESGRPEPLSLTKRVQCAAPRNTVSARGFIVHPSSQGTLLLGPAACRAFFMSFDGTSLQNAGFIPDQRQQLVPSVETNPARVAGFLCPA
jgi:hypothetical protein